MKLTEHLSHWARRARRRRVLLELADWQLKDLGLGRDDVFVMLGKR